MSLQNRSIENWRTRGKKKTEGDIDINEKCPKRAKKRNPEDTGDVEHRTKKKTAKNDHQRLLVLHLVKE